MGSFLNVCIYRLPLDKSVVFPASHCPNCDNKLGFFDLIPVLSYLSLRGKCRYCQAVISWRYPLVELVTGLLFVAVAVKFPPFLFWPEFVAYAVFLGLTMVVLFIDLEHQLIPDVISFSGIILGLFFNLFRGNVLSSFLGALLGFGLFFLIAKLGKFCFKKDAVGEGDLYLAAFLGAWFGWQGVLLVIFVAYLFAALVILPLLIFRKVNMADAVPFGPALVVGGLVTLFFGQAILGWYLGLLGF